MTFAYGLALGAYAFNVRIGDGPVQTYWLDRMRPSPGISLIAPPPPLTGRQVAWQYFTLGFTHIVPQGTDHILFVLGIFLLSARWRSILLQVSTFTIAHSITLGLTMYGVVSLPARIVEPMIALSIAYVALENFVTSELKPWRLALVFSFGLLHGMGFAGVLRGTRAAALAVSERARHLQRRCRGGSAVGHCHRLGRPRFGPRRRVSVSTAHRATGVAADCIGRVVLDHPANRRMNG